MKSSPNVPSDPRSQGKLISMYLWPVETERIDMTYVMFPKHAKRKNRNEIPSHDFRS